MFATKIYKGTDEADALLSTEGGDNHRWSYGFRAYVPDTHCDVRNYNENGLREDYLVERYSEAQALEWYEENADLWSRVAQAQRNESYWKDEYDRVQKNYNEEWQKNEANALATNAVVAFVADEGRKYAIQNELCENYERFLMLAVNREATRIGNERLISYYGSEVHNEDSRIGNRYRELLRMFVQHGTRTRGMTVTVGKRYNAYGVSASNLTLGEPATNYYGEDEESTSIVAESILSYEDACKANRYGIRNGWARGHYGLAPNAVEVEDEEI